MSSKTKITHVTRWAKPHIGGIEKVIEQINESLPSEEFEKEIICCSNELSSQIEDGVKYNRNKYLFEFASNVFSPQFIYNLSKVNTDVLHYHMPFVFAVIAHFIARPKFKKLCITYHGDIVGYDWQMAPFWKLYKYFFKKADKIHVLSPQIINKSPFLYENKEKCSIISYGIKSTDNTNSQEIEEIKRKYNDKKIILGVGRFVKFKGFIHAIKSMVKIDNAVLILIGNGPLKPVFENYIKENNLTKKVFLVGEISSQNIKDNYFKACDMLVVPSIQTSESFGIVQLEAMKFGKPVINTDLGTGVNYVSINNETGLTVKPNNTEDLMNAIKILTDNDELRNKLGNNAKIRVENIFNTNELTDLYKKFYLE